MIDYVKFPRISEARTAIILQRGGKNFAKRLHDILL